MIHLNLYLHEFIFGLFLRCWEGSNWKKYKLIEHVSKDLMLLIVAWWKSWLQNPGHQIQLKRQFFETIKYKLGHLIQFIKNSLKRFEFIFVSGHNSFFHLTKSAPITSVFVSVAEILHMTWFVLWVKDSAKLRALSAKNVFTCQTALRAYVLTWLTCLRAHVPTFLACSRVNVPWVLTCFTDQGVFRTYVLTCQRPL